MQRVSARDMMQIAPLFAGWKQALILSCLDGFMGEAHASRGYRSARIVNGDFCFLAGSPDPALLSHLRPGYIILIPQTPAWSALIEATFGVSVRRVVRYATKKESGVFSAAKLQSISSTMKRNYSLHPINEELYTQAMAEDWSRDLCSQFSSYSDYAARGLGVGAVIDGRLVSGASSYVAYRSGIEVEIDTMEPFRRQGLASACAARLILECMKRGLYPCWDAQNKASLALAEKLGYRADVAYPAYELAY